MKLRCAVDGVPQSRKWAQAEEPSNAGPSKRARSQLFISESGLEDEEVRVVAETAEVGVQAGNQISEECWEMVVALWAHNASIQLQVDAQEWMGHQVERLVQAMDHQRDAEEVLASALLRLSSEIRARLGRRRRSGAVSELPGLKGWEVRGKSWSGEQRTCYLKNIIIFCDSSVRAKKTRGARDSNPVKGTRLGGIRQVEIGDEFQGVPKFRRKDP